MSDEQIEPAQPAPQSRVLLVDDEPMIRAITAEYLMMEGYDVTEAADGAAAWDILQADADFDVLVTDRRMPEMDGLQLAEKVMNDRRLSCLPVVMQTGAAGKTEITEGARAGVFFYLPKPYTDETFITVMRAAIRDGRQRRFFESRMGGAAAPLAEGRFTLRTIAEAQDLALRLGVAFAKPERAVGGLYELLLNAIEHGNLGLGFDAKNAALAEGTWEAEITRRLALPENAGKRVTVDAARTGGKIDITIRDEGDGFDHGSFLELDSSRLTQGNGRGIAKAIRAFEKLEYLGNGSTVKIIGR